MSEEQKTILIQYSPKIEHLLEENSISYEIEHFLVLPEPHKEIIEKNYKVFPLIIPKKLIPVLNIIHIITGLTQKDFINTLIYKEFETLFETPTYIFDYYVNYSKSDFFKNYKDGLAQWSTLLQEQIKKKDHNVEEKTYAST
ncbi:MAG: hypothetical protein ACFFDH_16085 [Promethearchaeota archaeon]